ncbi:MAG: hypothetical protein RL660_1379 [Bacteroidota bacterium]|jgi:hypothetical protein
MQGLLDQHHNAQLIQDLSGLNLTDFNEAIILVVAQWSGPSISNCKGILDVLTSVCYGGHILLVDNDSLTPQFQEEFFGTLCHGWGECFVVKQGKICGAFVSKEGGANFTESFKAFILQQHDEC